MGILPTVGVQQVVEQSPVQVQQMALASGQAPPVLPLQNIEVHDVVEVTATAPLEPVGEFSEPGERAEPARPDRSDHSGKQRRPGRKKSRLPLDIRA